MSKKQQKNKVKPVELKIVDQQKEPCLRALQKKVRNANKKLVEISELQDKKDLKPQQIQKVNRKQQVVSERDKFLEFIDLYTGIVVENEKVIRKNQLVELEDIAIAIAVNEYEYNANKKDSQEIDNLHNLLVNPSQNITLAERVTQLTQTFTSLANNSKLKERTKAYYDGNQEKVVEAKVQEKVEEVKEVKRPLTPQSPEQQQQVLQPEETKQVEEEKIAEIKDEPEKVEEKPVQEEKVQEGKNNQAQDKPKEDNKKDDKRRNNDRDRKDRKNFRDYDKNYKNKNYQNKKPSFKPKYQEKTKGNDEGSDRSSSEEVPTFKKEDIKKLEDEGFIVVGKPKVKGRDQKEYHDHQHGRKNQHHHQNNNQNHHQRQNKNN